MRIFAFVAGDLGWMSDALWATMMDMTNTTAPRRTRLVWKTKEIRRTAAALAAYVVIGGALAWAIMEFPRFVAFVGVTLGMA